MGRNRQALTRLRGRLRKSSGCGLAYARASGDLWDTVVIKAPPQPDMTGGHYYLKKRPMSQAESFHLTRD